MALPSPQVGDLAVDLTYNCMRFYNGSKWVYFLTSQDSQPLMTAQKMGGTLADVGLAVASDNNGNTFITGYFTGTATFGSINITSFGYTDMFLAKVNAAGVVQWVRKGGSSLNYDSGIAVTVDVSGNVYVTGYFAGTANFEPTNASITSSAGSYDTFVAKYDTNGNLSWVASGGGTSTDVPADIFVDNAGNGYIVGYFYGSATFGSILTSAGGADYYLAKFSSSTGAFSSAVSGGGISDDYGKAITYDGSFIYIAGTFQGTATLGSGSVTSNGGTDIFQVKYTSGLSYVRKVTTGGAGYDYVTDIAYSSVPYASVLGGIGSGSVVMTGYFSSNIAFGSTTLTPYSTTTDMFIAKFTQFYDYEWAVMAGSQGANDEAHSVAIDAKGNIYVTGFISYDAIFGSNVLPENANTNKKVFYAKYGYNGSNIKAVSVSANDNDSDGSAICIDANGLVSIIGNFLGNVTINGTNLTSTGSNDILRWSIIENN